MLQCPVQIIHLSEILIRQNLWNKHFTRYLNIRKQYFSFTMKFIEFHQVTWVHFWLSLSHFCTPFEKKLYWQDLRILSHCTCMSFTSGSKLNINIISFPPTGKLVSRIYIWQKYLFLIQSALEVRSLRKYGVYYPCLEGGVRRINNTILALVCHSSPHVLFSPTHFHFVCVFQTVTIRTVWPHPLPVKTDWYF